MYDENPLLRVPNAGKTLLLFEADLWVNTINDLAKGDGCDLFRGIKEKTKSNRPERLSMFE